MNLKRALCLFVVLLLSVSIVGCIEKPTDSTSSAAGTESESSAYKDENGLYISKLPYQDFENREFRILVRGKVFDTYQSDDFTTDSELYGDLLNDAVARRNNYIEEKYHVKLTVIKSDTINEDIRNEAAANSGAYDAIMPAIPALASFAQSGYLYDLKSLNNFFEDAPWWDPNATKIFTIDNKLYFTTGDITILNKVCTPSILFNKDMVQEHGLENPYQLVRDMQWTFDKFVQMAKSVTVINSLDQRTAKENTFGLLTSNGDALAFYGASGETLCGKDENDEPYITFNRERSINVAKKVLETLANGDFAVFAEEFEKPIWVTSLNAFIEGRILFRPSGFSATTKIRKQSDLNFGIVPFPLWDDTQDRYYSYCTNGQVAGIAIPKSCDDPEFSAYMIDIYAAAAKNFITPAYYEVNLRTRDARDDESLEMLDIIFSNIVYDIGEAYNFGSIGTMLNTMLTNRETEVISRFEAIEGQVQADIDKTIIAYQSDME
ncbi:MAG TPA: extracellular solute-binding protein [Bacillota bacterium]|nr:extracellular solute-binding protein [Bacillota bacterium]HOK68821.1 extracellular solute-binding protein [Bacillota bacterium]HPP84894.1 extracellular solute-binding protein [Bacillota bacterium]